MIWLLVAATVMGYAQDDLGKAASSPYEIQRYIDTHRIIDWKPLWNSLGVDAEKLVLPPCGDSSGRQQRECSSELIEVLTPHQVLLRVTHVLAFEAYLRFLPREDGGWRFAGAFSPSTKHLEPRHKIIHFGEKPFLLVTGEGGAGSGFSSEYEWWMDLTRPDLKPVFGYTRTGYMSGLGLNIGTDVTATLISLQVEPVERIEIARSIHFSAVTTQDGNLSLGRGRPVRTVYTRRPDGTFSLDPALSNVTEKEVQDLYEHFFQGLSNEEVLHYALEPLERIAARAEGAEKRWLRAFLTKCKNTPEKRDLERLLADR